MSSADETSLYFVDGRAFGARHAAPTLTDAPEVGRVVTPRRPFPDALPLDALLELAARAKGTRVLDDVEAHQLAEGVEILAGDLELEREAHRMTVLELTAARETARETHRELEDAGADAAASLKTAQDEIADLKARLLGMTAVASDATRDAQAALAREGVALARLRKADGVQPALERPAETVTGRPYPEVGADLDAQVAMHPDANPDTLVVDIDDLVITPDEIAAALKVHREQDQIYCAPFVALADLVDDWVAATKRVQQMERLPPGRDPGLGVSLKRLDAVERDLVKAVRR